MTGDSSSDHLTPDFCHLSADLGIVFRMKRPAAWLSILLLAGVASGRPSEPFPPKGGAQLSNADVSAVAAYVWALGHQEQASR